jgi:hypothetical protein
MKITAPTLPSRAIPYSFKEIEMDMFGVKQIMLLSKASALNSIKPAIDALNDVISVEANELTDGDFFYLLTLQRLRYTRPLFTQWVCEVPLYYEKESVFHTSEGLRALVEAYEVAENKDELQDPDKIQVVVGPCGTLNKHELCEADLQIQYMDETKLPEGLDYPRIESFADSIVEYNEPDMQYLSQAVRWLKTDSRSYLAKKNLFLKQDNLNLIEQAMFYKNTSVHGVRRTIVCRCTKCRTASTHTLEIGPESFFDV